MKSSKIVGLLVGLLIVGGLGYYAYYLMQNDGKSDTTELIDFEIKDVDQIDKIEIYDPFFNASFIVQRQNNVWTDKDGNCIQQAPVETMLKTFRNVTFKGYVGEALKPTVTKMMSARAKKVTVYQNGEMYKTWYVGHSTPDHYGTYMLVETPSIKSDQPVIMSMKGLNGILEPRFFVDPNQWACTDLFSFAQKDIEKITVKNTIDIDDSYEVTRESSGFVATQFGVPLENVSKEKLTFFMNGFENIHYNKPNYDLSEQQVDSLRAVVPYVTMDIETSNKETYNLKLYKDIDRKNSTKDSIVYDLEYVWTFNNYDELVKMQYFVIGPLIDGKDIFVNKTVNN